MTDDKETKAVKNKNKSIHIRISPSTHKWFRIKAAREEVCVSDVIERALNMYIKEVGEEEGR